MRLEIWEGVVKYWVLEGCAAISAVFYFVVKKYKKKHEDDQCKNKAVELGVRAILRTQIITTYNKYMERGSIPIYELDNVNELLKQYKNLGGNGIIIELVEKLMQLPQPNTKHHLDVEAFEWPR